MMQNERAANYWDNKFTAALRTRRRIESEAERETGFDIHRAIHTVQTDTINELRAQIRARDAASDRAHRRLMELQRSRAQDLVRQLEEQDREEAERRNAEMRNAAEKAERTRLENEAAAEEAARTRSEIRVAAQRAGPRREGPESAQEQKWNALATTYPDIDDPIEYISGLMLSFQWSLEEWSNKFANSATVDLALRNEANKGRLYNTLGLSPAPGASQGLASIDEGSLGKYAGMILTRFISHRVFGTMFDNPFFFASEGMREGLASTYNWILSSDAKSATLWVAKTLLLMDTADEAEARLFTQPPSTNKIRDLLGNSAHELAKSIINEVTDVLVPATSLEEAKAKLDGTLRSVVDLAFFVHALGKRVEVCSLGSLSEKLTTNEPFHLIDLIQATGTKREALGGEDEIFDPRRISFVVSPAVVIHRDDNDPILSSGVLKRATVVVGPYTEEAESTAETASSAPATTSSHPQTISPTFVSASSSTSNPSVHGPSPSNIPTTFESGANGLTSSQPGNMGENATSSSEVMPRPSVDVASSSDGEDILCCSPLKDVNPIPGRIYVENGLTIKYV